MYLDFHTIFQDIDKIDRWSIQSLSQHFQIPPNYFAEVDPGVLLIVHKWAEQPIGYLLRGSIFFVNARVAVRGMPKIMYGSIYQETIPAAIEAEKELLSCLKTNPILFEEKLDGVNIRMYRANSHYYFATRMKYDGLSDKGSFRFGDMAKEIIDKNYPAAYALVDDGYVPIFELLSPRFDYLSIPALKDDIVILDILKDNKFLHRAEKEALAARYELKTCQIISTIDRQMTHKRFLKEIKKLEYHCHQLGIEGVVAKAFINNSDQVFLKIKTQDIRSEHWGTSGIPKRFIVEIVRNLKAELSLNEFVDQSYTLPKLIEELSDDFIISEKNSQKIKRYYAEIQSQVQTELAAIERAQTILKNRKFNSKKELAEATKAESRFVRYHLFREWKGDEN